ncbi:MAG TPA: histidine phosphatase family protein [Rhodopirellula baltica]|nr:histidine phosphatase family protein [Rhodopirellula baltica]HBE63103.1 histidine phosphatase family protein [Rhodopirellula baltica]
MSDQFPQIYLARHGETPWTITGQHTGSTDMPLTPKGERNATQLQGRLEGIRFNEVWTSPLQRAKRTCELAGYGERARVVTELAEWDCGAYEGLTRNEIHQKHPDWNLFRDGCPNGESLTDVATRVDRVIQRIRQRNDTCLLFAHKHFLQVFAACWVGLPPETGQRLFLGTAALSIVGYHHDQSDSVIRLWNDRSYLTD